MSKMDVWKRYLAHCRVQASWQSKVVLVVTSKVLVGLVILLGIIFVGVHLPFEVMPSFCILTSMITGSGILLWVQKGLD